jgi:hypothetical protein
VRISLRILRNLIDYFSLTSSLAWNFQSTSLFGNDPFILFRRPSAQQRTYAKEHTAHSITSLATASKVSGILRLSVFSVLRFDDQIEFRRPQRCRSAGLGAHLNGQANSLNKNHGRSTIVAITKPKTDEAFAAHRTYLATRHTNSHLARAQTTGGLQV